MRWRTWSKISVYAVITRYVVECQKLFFFPTFVHRIDLHSKVIEQLKEQALNSISHSVMQ